MAELNAYTIGMILIFFLGYSLITIEHIVKVNKATVALFTATLCWTLQFIDNPCNAPGGGHCIADHISTISQIVFFIWGALTIVEVINLHQGFKPISDLIRVTSKRKFLWIIGILAFFLSSLLDNLTTTIVMVTLISKLLEEGEDRLLIGGGVVIAANAGGAWTPIGDVTTTMLWIGGQLTTEAMLKDLIIPSVVCMVVAFIYLTFMLKGEFKLKNQTEETEVLAPWGKTVGVLGIGLLVFVPVFKMLTGLPPFLGMLFGLSVLWIFTDIVHKDKANRDQLKVPYALAQIDASAMLFFLGILLCVGALESSNLLSLLANWMDAVVGNATLIAIFIGLASAVIDNVPLVAAAMGMYSLEQYAPDEPFWQLVAYCAGTGGSILVIGSAAGVVFMSLEKVRFFWYLKRIGIPATLGFFAGILVYFLI